MNTTTKNIRSRTSTALLSALSLIAFAPAAFTQVATQQIGAVPQSPNGASNGSTGCVAGTPGCLNAPGSLPGNTTNSSGINTPTGNAPGSTATNGINSGVNGGMPDTLGPTTTTPGSLGTTEGTGTFSGNAAAGTGTTGSMGTTGTGSAGTGMGSAGAGAGSAGAGGGSAGAGKR